MPEFDHSLKVVYKQQAVKASIGSEKSLGCICCKPNVLSVRWSPSDAAYLITAELES